MNHLHLSDRTFASVWHNLLYCLVRYGKEAESRGMKHKEILAVQLHVEDGLSNSFVSPERDLSYRFMVAEWLWILSGRNDVNSIALWNKRIRDFSDDGTSFYGAYGTRLRYQLPDVLRRLIADGGTRQAVATIYEPNPPQTKDVPCTLSVQVFVREGKLHTIVTMRSSDVWLGLPYDFFNFSMIANIIANSMELEVGPVTFNLGSSHLYDTDYEKASAVVPHAPEVLRSPRLEGPAIATISGKFDYLMHQAKLAFRSGFDVKSGLLISPSPEMIPQGLFEGYMAVLTSRTNKEALDVLKTIAG